MDVIMKYNILLFSLISLSVQADEPFEISAHHVSNLNNSGSYSPFAFFQFPSFHDLFKSDPIPEEQTQSPARIENNETQFDSINFRVFMKTNQNLDFEWQAVKGMEQYQIFARANNEERFLSITPLFSAEKTHHQIPIKIHAIPGVEYYLEACNLHQCLRSNVVSIGEELNKGIDYIKAQQIDDGNHFGEMVVISDDGQTLAISAPSQDIYPSSNQDSIKNAGAVYLYQRDHSGDWQFDTALYATNPGYRDQFGSSLSLSENGRILVVSAEFEDGGEHDLNQKNNDVMQSGAVYIYEKTARGWRMRTYLKSPQITEFGRFGKFVNISNDGQYIAVSGFEKRQSLSSEMIDFEINESLIGRVYIYRQKRNRKWELIDTLIPPFDEKNQHTQFGYSFDFSDKGKILAVSSPTIINQQMQTLEIEKNNVEGQVLVYSHRNSKWQQKQIIYPEKHQSQSSFGHAVSLSEKGDRIAISAHEGVYLFELTASSRWQKQTYLVPEYLDAGDYFGHVISLSANGEYLAVGAPMDDSDAKGFLSDPQNNDSPNSGAVYVYRQNENNEWLEMSYLKANHDQAYQLEIGNQFGHAISFSKTGETLVIGAWRESNYGLFSGASYIF